ncbi:Alpha/Beta hydrolase protein [Coniochaeta sp. 2T2.1]|nr:Alpha/Beta hydrolase protein [Coniochaeta sp. 2T2.1]
MDFRDYGIPAPEWKEYVATHPEAGATARLPEDQSPSEMQAEINAQREQMSERLFEAEGLKSAVRIQHAEICFQGESPRDKLTARVYTKVLGDEDLELDKVAAVVYFHAGLYVCGNPDTEEYLCSVIASKLRVVVVHICYRQAPQHPHPAAHNDGKAGFEWVVENAEHLGIDPEQIVIVGLCSGAGVAVSTCLRLCNEEKEESHDIWDGSPDPSREWGEKRDRNKTEQQKRSGDEKEDTDDSPSSRTVTDGFTPPGEERRETGRVKGLVLGFPWLLQESSFPYHAFSSRDATSRVQCAEAPVISKEVYDRLSDVLGVEDQTDLWLNVPLAKDAELAKFPRTAFILSGLDLFRDDGILFADRLHTLGVPRRVHMFPGMPHAFRKYDDLWSSKRFDDVLLLLINWALNRTISSMDVGFHVELLREQPQKQAQENRI